MINIISHTNECYSFTDDNGNPYPALQTAGCGCCRSYLPITQANLDEALKQAREWVETLESLTPVEYPPDVEFP